MRKPGSKGVLIISHEGFLQGKDLAKTLRKGDKRGGGMNKMSFKKVKGRHN